MMKGNGSSLMALVLVQTILMSSTKKCEVGEGQSSNVIVAQRNQGHVSKLFKLQTPCNS